MPPQYKTLEVNQTTGNITTGTTGPPYYQQQFPGFQHTITADPYGNTIAAAK